MKVRTAHASMQYKDSNKQHTQDVEKIFDRAVNRRYAWISGTEAGDGAGNLPEELVRVGTEAGYRMHVPSLGKGSGKGTDCWLGVREDLIDSGWKTEFRPAIPSSSQLYKDAGLDPKLFPRWAPKGLVAAQWNCHKLGSVVNLGVAHYLTKARSPEHSTIHGINHWEQNEKLAETVDEWAHEVGKGRALAFYTGDQNMADSKNNSPQGDTFMGGSMTSLADELKKWQSTGHGPIDVMASYNKDGRVKGQNFVVLDDKEFFLNTDHFFCEGTYDVTVPVR